MNCRNTVKSALLIILPTLFLTIACENAPTPAESTKVIIETGEVRGKEHLADTYAWFGIPYAAPPIGDLRWRAPQPAIPWDGVLDALEYGSLCIQPPNGLSGDVAPMADRVMGSEDCLSLNVYAPKSALTADQPLPVMFWIHGGYNLTGSSQTQEGAYLAATQNVIVVSVNYRLGLLGWFRHQSLRTTAANLEDASGNYGVLDLVAALKWVQSNVSSFGGDPTRVTVFGESAGGRNTWALVQTPLAKDLFHGAIVQSGTLRISDPDKSEAYDKNQLDYPAYENNSAEVVAKLVDNADSKSAVEVANALRQVSASDLYATTAEEGSEGDIDSFSSPKAFLDGHVFVAPPLALFNDPSRYNSVPIITGSNLDELKIAMAFDERWVDKSLGFLPKVKDADRYANAGRYNAENWRVTTVDLPAEVITKNGGAPIYNYRLDYDDLLDWPVDLPTLIGSMHGLDIAFIFGLTEEFPFSMLLGDEDERLELSASMMNYWGEFAHTGKPGRGSQEKGPEWNQWQTQGEHLMLFDSTTGGGVRMVKDRLTMAKIKQRLKNDPLFTPEEKCTFYRSIFLNGYNAEFAFDREEYREFAGEPCPMTNPDEENAD